MTLSLPLAPQNGSFLPVMVVESNDKKSEKMPWYASTVVPVFRGLCDQGTPAVSGQYNDVRGDFQYKLTLDQGTPANADADRHLFVIFAPQPGDSALFILFFITLGRKRYHTGSQTLSNLFANAHSIAQTDVLC